MRLLGILRAPEACRSLTEQNEGRFPDFNLPATPVAAGFNVLRFWNHEVLGQVEAVTERIWLELQKKGALLLNLKFINNISDA